MDADSPFWELHNPATLPRQGPGSAADTLRAWRIAVDALPAAVRAGGSDRPLSVVDMGCGPGPSTLTIAEELAGAGVGTAGGAGTDGDGKADGADAPPSARIVAIDVHKLLLDVAREREAEAAARVGRPLPPIRWVEFDMLRLGGGDAPVEAAAEAAAVVPPHSVDVLWSEGAIYIAGGLRPGLKRWAPLLRPGSVAAVTELSWLHDCAGAEPPADATDGADEPDGKSEAPDRAPERAPAGQGVPLERVLASGVPASTAEFWCSGYPAMNDIASNEAAARAAGFEVLASWPLGEAAWRGYYGAIAANAAQLKRKAEAALAGDGGDGAGMSREDAATALEFIAGSEQERAVFDEGGIRGDPAVDAHGRLEPEQKIEGHFSYVFYVLRKT